MNNRRMSATPKSLRRSSRIKSIEVSNSSDINESKRPKRSRKVSNNEGKDPDSEGNILKHEIEEELHLVEENNQKPMELFNEDDVSGGKIYGFQTPVKRNAMIHKANLCRTPITPKSSRGCPTLKVVIEKVNINDNKIVQNKITVEAESTTNRRQAPTKVKRWCTSGMTSSESESISEEEEYIPEDAEESDESESDNIEISDESNDYDEEVRNQIARLKFARKNVVISTPKRQGSKYKTTYAYKDYHVHADNYFATQSGKIVTSNHTLGKLANPRLTEEKLRELLVNQDHIPKVHRRSISNLSENCKKFYPMWHFILQEGYSLLLHGLGSKRSLINDFHKEVVVNHPTLVVNGFFPSLTMKEILDGIIEDLLELDSPANPVDAVKLITQTLGKHPNDSLYLLIHNIDGIMLRGGKAQDILSRLAGLPNLRILASIDHINSPLIWDHVKKSKFNFYWWDATTFVPYKEETSFESSLMVQQSGALALSSLHNVFLSLTSNARSIYILLVKYQLENGASNNFTGMAFKDLYRAAREAFLVSSDLALRAQLTEFVDHKLVRTKRNIDGAEHLIIPLNKGLLKQFLEQHDNEL